MPGTRSIAAALAAAAALALVACGGGTDEKNDYVDRVNEVTSALNSGLTEVSTEATAISSQGKAADVFARFGTSLENAAKEIEEIEPPEEVAGLHDRLVQQVKTLAAEATNAADEIKAGGPAAAPGAAGQFVGEATRGSNEVDATISEINLTLQE